VDRGLDPEVLSSVRQGAENGLTQSQKPRSNAGVTGGIGTRVSDVRGTKSGAYYIVDVEVEVPGEMTVEVFEGIKGEVTEGVMEEVKSVKIVRVFVKSMGSEGK
jgi:divalent metal cation (Fe/Co/Zn/Cd) transporter